MPLKYRIAATIFGLETVLIAIVLWMTLGHSLTSVREQLASTEDVTLSLLGDLSRSAFLTDEFAELQTFVERTKQDPRIRTVVIGDAAGRVVVATEAQLIGSPFPDFTDKDLRYWRTVEINSHAGHLGSLAVQFSQRPLIDAYSETRALGVSVAVIGMVLIALVGLGMGFVLTRRLAGLARAADQVASGDTAIRVEIDGRDEVARVGRAFNSMVDRIAENLAALKAARDRLLHPTEAMSEGFALWDAEDRLVLHNRRFLELFGRGRVALGDRFEDLVRLICGGALADEGHGTEARIRERIERHHDPRGVVELPLKDGRWVGISEFRTPDGGTVSIYSDISEGKRRQRALEEGERRLRAIMNSVIDGILTVAEDGTIETANSGAGRIFGWSAAQMIGRSLDQLVGREHAGEAEPGPIAHIDLGRLPPQSVLELVGRRRSGARFPVEMSVTELDLHGPRTFIVTLRDITERKAAQEMVLFHATHDPLTGLPNRTLFDDRLATALSQAARRGEMLAVMFLDLDRFKLINDTLGHTTGDALLVALSTRLRSSVRQEDTVARMGGDEFIFILRGLKSAEDAVKPAQNILERMRPPFHVDGHELHLTGSIGISLYPADGIAHDQLLKCADLALYRAKERGRNRLQLYNPTLNVRVFHQLNLERSLRRAIGQQQFALIYQPQVALDTGQIVGLEALVRWHHPDLGLVMPDDFLPLAEETGLIEPLGHWVLRTACLQHRAWRDARLAPPRLAVNVSARECQRSGLEQRVCDVLAETGMKADWLELELTESVLMQEGDGTADLLAYLDALGITLALDDFGTGYASLSYLRRFPIKRVKIDRALVRDIETSEGDTALARAAIAMAHGLGVRALAEGIETPGQLALLRRYGCDQGQGFLLGRPVAASEIAALLRRGNLAIARGMITAEAS